MTVMLVGANGFIGNSVAHYLVARGCDVVAVSRNPHESAPGVVQVPADRANPNAIRGAAEQHGARIVIDMLALTEDVTRGLLDVLAGAIDRYILVSSCDVYRNYGGLRKVETGEPILTPVGEDAPLRTHLYPYRGQQPRRAGDPLAWMDAYDKITVEKAVMAQQEFDWTIARLPMVFGPGDKQRRLAWAIGPMCAGAKILELDSAWAGWRSTHGFVDDVGDAIALAATHEGAKGRIYNLGMRDTPSNAEWASRIAESLDWGGEVRLLERTAVPESFARALDAMDLSYPMIVDTSRIRRELGFVEPTSESEALRRTIADEIGRGKAR